MKFPELCAIDIDGTLVGPRKTISDQNSSGISAYVEAGGIVTLASGRMHSSMLHYCAQLALPPSNIVLSYNGAMARTVGGEILFERPVPAVYGVELIDYCRENRLHLNFYLNDRLFVSELDQWSQLYYDRTGSVPVAVGDLSMFSSQSPTKLLICGDKARLDPLVPYFQERYQNQLFVTKTDDEYLEFMAAGVDKRSGLMWVCQKLGIDQAECAAFGDSYNDIQMIEWAGTGIAMSNGRSAAIDAAQIVGDNSEWSAVGDQLIKFVNERKEMKG